MNFYSTLVRGALTVLGVWIAVGATSRAEKQQLPVDLALLSRQQFEFVSIRPADVIGLFPGVSIGRNLNRELDSIFDELREKTGLPLAEIERLSFVNVSPSSAQPVLFVTSKQKCDYPKLLKTLGFDKAVLDVDSKPGRPGEPGEAVPVDGRLRQIHVGAKSDKSGLYRLDDRTYMVGSINDLTDILRNQGGPEADPPMINSTKAVEYARKGHHLVVAIRPETLLQLFSRRKVPSEPPFVGSPTGSDQNPPPKDLPKSGIPGSPPDLPPLPKPPAPPEPLQVAFVQPDRKATPPPFPVKKVLEELPPELLAFNPLLQADEFALGFSFGPKTTVECQFAYPSKALANDGETALRTSVYVMRQLLGSLSRSHVVSESAHSMRVVAFLGRIERALRTTKCRVLEEANKNYVLDASLGFESKADQWKTLLEEMEIAAARTRSSNNLKILGVGFHSFHDRTGTFPAAAIIDKSGKPLLSWRVALLPYIGEGRLYKEFRKDEPWDSAHNKKLLAKMPSVYAPVRGKTKSPHSTYYRVFVGSETAFVDLPGRPNRYPAKGRSLNTILAGDGMSNSFLVVEASEAVPWTKPEPMVFDPKKPLPKMAGQFERGFHALHADAAVHFFRTDIDPKVLRYLIEVQDGRLVDWERLLVTPPRRR